MQQNITFSDIGSSIYIIVTILFMILSATKSLSTDEGFLQLHLFITYCTKGGPHTCMYGGKECSKCIGVSTENAQVCIFV